MGGADECGQVDLDPEGLMPHEIADAAHAEEYEADHAGAVARGDGVQQ